MPQFVPVYDPERPRAEQTDEDETIFHRKWDAPHQLHTKPVGVSDRNNFARMAGKKGGLIQNEKGLWVPPDKVRKAEVAAQANKIDAPEVFPSHRPFRKREREKEVGGSDNSDSGSSEDDGSDSDESVKPDGSRLSVETQDPHAVFELASKAAAVAKERLSKNPYLSKVETKDEFDYQPRKSKSSATTSAELISSSPFVALCDDVGEQSAAVKKKIRDAQAMKKSKKKKSKSDSLSGKGSISKTSKKKRKKDGTKKDKLSKEAKRARKEQKKLIAAAEVSARSVPVKPVPTKAAKNDATDLDRMVALGLPVSFG